MVTAVVILTITLIAASLIDHLANPVCGIRTVVSARQANTRHPTIDRRALADGVGLWISARTTSALSLLVTALIMPAPIRASAAEFTKFQVVGFFRLTRKTKGQDTAPQPVISGLPIQLERSTKCDSMECPMV